MTKFGKLLLFLPAILAVLLYFLPNNFELYPRVGWVDAGMYVSYANNDNLIKDYNFSGNNYQGTRLGYVVPANFFNSILSPTIGRYAFVVTFYLSALLALLFLAKRVIKRIEIQSLFMMVVICNPLLLAGIAYGGADGPAATYIILSAVFLYYSTYAAKPKFHLSLAGIFAALSFSSHILAIVPLIIIFSSYTLLQKNSLIGNFLTAALAFLVTIAFVSWIGFQLGIERNYLLYSFSWGVQSVKGIGVMFTQPISEMVIHFLIYIPPIFLILAAIKLNDGWGNIFVNLRQKIHCNYAVITIILSLGPLLFFLVYDKILGGSISQYLSYYQLIYPCFVLAFLFALAHNKVNFSKKNIILINTVLLSLLMFTAFNVAISYSLLLIACAFVISIYISFTAGNINRTNMIISGLLFMLLTTQYLCFSHNKSIIPFYSLAGSAHSKELYTSQLKFMSSINKLNRAYSLPYFMYDSTANKSNLMPGQYYHTYFNSKKNIYNYFDSLTALYLWDRSILTMHPYNEDFKTVIEKSNKDRQVVILGSNKQEVSAMYDRMFSELKGIKPIVSECYQNKYYPWCFTVVKEFSTKS